MKYVYPAIFTPDDGGFDVVFPDIESCYTCGDDLSNAIYMAEDVLCLMLYDMECDGKAIPKASKVNDIKTNGEEFVSLIQCDTDFYKRFYKNKAVKKTLSIPAWLNDEAIAKNINFSQVLQDGLKSALGL